MGQLALFFLKQLIRDDANVVKKTQVSIKKSIIEGINCSSCCSKPHNIQYIITLSVMKWIKDFIFLTTSVYH